MEEKSDLTSDEGKSLQFLIDEGLEMLAVYKSIVDPQTRKQALRVLQDMAAAQDGNSH